MAGTGDTNTPTVSKANEQLRSLAIERIPAGGLLLIPESTNDRVMSFDPLTGDLVDPDFIPADATNLSTPIEALLSPDGTLIYVSDQLVDVVQAFDVMTGSFVATFAPAGGVDTAILDNVRGMAFRPNGNLLVSVGGGANDDAIAEFDGTGAYVGNFVANGAAGLDSPFDVFAVSQPGGALASGDYLVPGITSDAIHRYDSSGAAQANFAALDTFGEQVTQAINGNVLVANFSGTQEGIVEFTPAGALVGVYDPDELGDYRGVYDLPNGNLLITNGIGVHEIDRSGNLIRTIVADVSARFITLVQGEVDAPGLATFRVTKQFTDGNPAEVRVELHCNHGLPLIQGFDISNDQDVNFVLSAFADGEPDCTITEVSADGYQTVYYASGQSTPGYDGDGCYFDEVGHGDVNICNITNQALPVEVEVTKNWVTSGNAGNAVKEMGTVTVSSPTKIVGGYPCDHQGEAAAVSDYCAYLQFYGPSSDTQSVMVYPAWDGVTVDISEEVVQSYIETENDCGGSIEIFPGQGGHCTVTNTVFFEGIPTLNQYGLVLLALLMMGVGVAGFRRFG